MHPVFKQLEDLPPHLQQQVIVLAQTLVKHHRQKAAKPLKQTWAGAMRDYRDQYTSLSLQQEVVEQWSNCVSD
ncbi:MAG: DUF2281 domain-containing protein [Pseudanabaenales cyanobacterium]|nr:DUF2281 domain-containing protein [Pseudanabaenales cyanobacterium]